MTDRQLRTYGHKVRCLLRFSGKESPSEITQQDVDRFRREEHGRSPATIESAIQAAAALSGSTFTGKKLPRPRSRNQTIPLDDLSRVYAVAHKRQNVFVCRFLKWAYVTGFRLGDLLTLIRDQMAADIVELDASKTRRYQKYHAVPRHPILQCRLPAAEFPLKKSPARLRDKLKYYCDLAGVPHFGPQKIRRTTTTQYELARPGAGAIIQGSALKGPEACTWKYYIDQVQILTEAQLRLAIPDAMQPKSLRTRQRREEKQLVEAFKRIGSDERETLLRMVNRLSW